MEKIITNVNVDEANESSAVNVSHVKSNVDQLNEYRKITVLENSDELTINGETTLEIPFKAIIYDDTIIYLDDVSPNLIVGGLFKIEVITDPEGQYDDAFIDLVVVRLNADGVEEESVVSKHHLNETLVNPLTKTIDGDERLKLRVTNTNADKQFILQATLSFDKLY